MQPAPAVAPAPFRSIRVFVSSTFRDMQAEREELVKRVFPIIRRLCETRGVSWSEVDLRWGVTDEQKAEGAVLPICLAEIDRSRPFFIGLLGQRYGWVPEELPTGLADQLPWLSDLAGTSVTEMEILHGVLNDPSAAGHAFFYDRDPAWVDARPENERLVLGEVETDDEIATLGADAAGRAAAARRQRLDELKQRIRDAGMQSWRYPDPRALGERVLADFTALVEQLYPLHDVPDALQRDADAHRAYGQAQTLGQLRRPALMARLNTFAEGVEAPLLVSGPTGSGASAVVTSWLHDWAAEHPDDIVFEHHIGATADASEWMALAGRLIGELHRRDGGEADSADGADPAELPGDAVGRRAALFAAFERAGGSSRRTIVVVDGVDLLSDVDGARTLAWLPAVLPARVRIVLTSATTEAVDEAARRTWPVLEVPMLDEAERRDLIREFLGRYSKGLDEVHVASIVSAPATGSPLYLRTVLDELRQHGDHFTLGAVIERLLSEPTLDGLLQLVFERYEGDFERDRPGLVRDSMSALWAARKGLSEPELMDIVGGVVAPLPAAVWSPLVLAAEAGLVTANGQLVFATESHRRAVESRYLADDDARRAAHRALARTFSTYELGPRVVDELPWQQLAAGDVDALAATLADLEFTALAYRRSYADLRRLWARAEAAGHPVVDGYRTIVDDPASDPDVAWEVARLVTDAGYPTQAAALNRFVVDLYRRGTDDTARRRLPAALVNHGAALMGRGELAAAEPVFQEAIDLSRQRNDVTVLQAALGDLALSRRDRGDLDGALPLFAEVEALTRRLGDPVGLQAVLGNKAQLLRQRGDYDAAMATMTEQEQLCRSLGDSAGVARALAAQGAVLVDTGAPVDALTRFVAFREVAEDMGDLRSVAEAGINEADTLRQIGRRDDATARAVVVEALVRRLSDEPLLARVLDVQARIAVDEGRWSDAERFSTEAVLTAKSAGALPAAMLALGMLGSARRELGDVAGARAAHEEEEALALGLGDVAATATARVNLASVDIVAGDLAGSLRRYALAEPALRSLGAQAGLATLYSNRWQVHAQLGNTPAAIDDLAAGGRASAASGALQQSQQMLTAAIEQMYGTGRQGETEGLWSNLADVSRALSDDAALQRAIGERALMVIGRGDSVLATTLLDEQEQICRRIVDQAGLAACIGNRAILLRNTGDLAGALACIDQQLEIARTAGDGQSFLFATANRGEVLGAMGRVGDGLAALTEARTMATNWKLTPMVEELDRMIAVMRAGQQ